MWRHAFSVVGLCRLSSIQALSANENYNNKSTDCQHCGWANTALLTGKYSTLVQVHCMALRAPLIRPRDVQAYITYYGILYSGYGKLPTCCPAGTE